MKIFDMSKPNHRRILADAGLLRQIFDDLYVGKEIFSLSIRKSVYEKIGAIIREANKGVREYNKKEEIDGKS